MYLFIKNTKNLTKKIFGLIVKKINLLLTLSILLFATNIYAEEKFVGFIESLKGEVFKSADEKKIKLNEFDQVFIGNEITLSSNANVSISFLDNSILTLNNEGSFIIKEFNNLSQNPKFTILIDKGNFTFESGTIAKNKNGNMKINLSEMEIGLNGTLVSGFNSGEEKQISLVKDSLGKVGTLSVTVGDQTTTITNPSTGISLSGNNAIQQTTLSEEETSQIKDFIKEVTVDAQTETEEDINRAVAKQLAAGTIPDANGDGITDANDMDFYKAQLFEFKGTRMGYYMEMSDGDDIGLMSDMIRYSDPSQSIQLMQGMMENDPANASLMMSEVSKDGFDVFSHISSAESENGNMAYRSGDVNFEDIRATLVSGMMNDQSDFSAATLAQVMSVSDSTMNSYLVNEITNFASTDPDANLSMKIMTNYNDIQQENNGALFKNQKDVMNTLATNAFQNATDDDVENISAMMQKNPAEDSAFLMETMIQYNPEMVADVYDDLSSQDFDIFDHIETAKTQNLQTTFQDPANFTTEINILPNPTENYADQNQYINRLKNEMFTEIMKNSEGTAAEIAGDIMMNTSGGNTQFMMENIVESNPEALVALMDNFAEESFDVFDHIKTNTISQNITPSAFLEINNQIPDGVIDSALENNQITGAIIKLTKEEKKELRQQKKIEKKAARKAARKAAKILAKAERKRVRQLAKQQGQDNFEETFTDVAADQFKTSIFTEMLTNADEATMTTMAKIASSGDAETASLIFETVMYEQSASEGSQDTNLTLSLLNNLSNMESETVDDLFEDQEDLASNMVNTALTNVTSNDSDAVANIISSSGNEKMNEAVFTKISTNKDQSMTSNVFTTLSNSTTGAEAIVAMASSNQSLYENMAQDVSSASMTAASLLTNISNTENYTNSTTATITTTDNTSTEVGTISWETYPATSGTYSTNTYISISGKATSLNGVTYSASDLPDGLSFDYTSGLIFGTPTSSGDWTSTITAYDKIDTTSFATASLSFSITEDISGDNNQAAGGGTLYWSTTPTAPGTLTKDTAISPIYLNVTGGVGAITYTTSGLPDGLVISASSIIGTPNFASPTGANVTITAMDADNNTVTTSLNFPIVSVAPTYVSWNAVTGLPGTLQVGTSIDTIPLRDFLNAAPATTTWSVASGTLPSGLDFNYSTGEISGTPDTAEDAKSITVKVQETGVDNNSATSMSINFPIVAAAGGETLSFATAPGTLTNVSGGIEINETISAIASQGSAVTYSFVSTNNKNMNGRSGTAIIITGNTISGIAPRLVVAATYSFVVTASANAGALVNTETFSIDIAGGAYCVSPVSNICL